MERVRRLGQLWSWLPAFRVVAETEHLPTAARELGLSPQALSRSIKLLEAELDVELFQRVGRRIQLSEAGRRLLDHTRTAMRVLDDGVSALGGDTLVGQVGIAALAHHAWLLVLPTLEKLRPRYPGLVPQVLSMEPELAREALRRGSVDLCIEELAVPQQGLSIEPLVELGYGIFCGASHPLFELRESELDLEAILEHRFIVPPEGLSDGWPPELERRAGIRVSSFHIALELCFSGSYLAVLPDAVTAVDRSSRRLRRLPVEVGKPRPLYLIGRQPLGKHQLAEIVAAALRREARDLSAVSAQPPAGASTSSPADS